MFSIKNLHLRSVKRSLRACREKSRIDRLDWVQSRFYGPDAPRPY
jgi:hypothetical protein